MLLLPALAYAEAPALECHGAGGGTDRDLRFAVTLTGLVDNSVVVDDLAGKQSCSCKFRHDGFFDRSGGKIQDLLVSLRYQSCDAGCSADLRKRMNVSIDVSHLLRGGRSKATPFVGKVGANCDRFSFDLPALRRIESERIDAMDGTPEFKRRLKDLKGLLDADPTADGTRQAETP